MNIYVPPCCSIMLFLMFYFQVSFLMFLCCRWQNLTEMVQTFDDLEPIFYGATYQPVCLFERALLFFFSVLSPAVLFLLGPSRRLYAIGILLAMLCAYLEFIRPTLRLQRDISTNKNDKPPFCCLGTQSDVFVF